MLLDAQRWDHLARLVLLLFIFSIPWEEMVVIPGVGSLTKILGALGAFCVLIFLAVERRAYYHFFFIVAGAFVAWSALSIGWSLNRDATVLRVVTYVQLLGMAFLIFQVADKAFIKHAMVAFSLGCWVLVLGTFHQFVLGIEAHHQRFSAPGTNPNTLAAAIALALPMAVLAMRDKSLSPWLFIGLLVFVPAGLITIILTGSRAGFVLMSLSLLALCGYLASLSRRFRWRTLLFWVMATVVLISATPLETAQRGAGTFSEIQAFLFGDWDGERAESSEGDAGGQDLPHSSEMDDKEAGTLSSRTEIWSAGWQVFLDNRWAGVGAGAFASAVENVIGQPQAPHNVYLGLSVEGGIPGLVLWLLIMVIALLACRDVPEGERKYLALMLVMLFLMFLVGNSEWRKMTWLLLVLPVCFSRKKRFPLAFGLESKT